MRALLVASLVVALGRSAGAEEAIPLTLLFAGDLYGELRAIDCGGDGPRRGDLAHLVRAVDLARAELAAAGQPAPVLLSTGDLIGPKALARFLLAQGDVGAQKVAGWLARAGFDAIALGNNDLTAVPERLRAYLRAAASHRLQLTAANLVCAAPDEEICAAVAPAGRRFLLVERAGLRLAIVGVVHPDLRDQVPDTHLPGVAVGDPARHAAEAAAAARRAGADLVIILAHLDHSETVPSRVVELARAVPDADLILSSAMHAFDDRGLLQLRFADGRTPIIGGDAYAEQLGRVTLTVERRGGRATITAVDPFLVNTAGFAPEPQLDAELQAAHAWYCDAWGSAVGDTHLAEPMTARDFATLMLQVLRHTTGSELAFVHRGLVEEVGVFPLTGALTRHHFFSALPQRNRVYTFSLTGAALQALCQRLAVSPTGGAGELWSAGLSCTPKPSVNGRPIDPLDTYRAATIEHLARGSFGHFSAQTGAMALFNPEGAAQAPILGELARALLESPAFAAATGGLVDAERSFPDLAERLRWVWTGNLDLNLADTRIHNPAGYADQVQLSQIPVFGLRGEARGKVAADSTRHGVSLETRVRYAQTDTDDQGLVESDDLTHLDLLYRLRLLRAAWPRWWTPILYAGGTLETELTAPRPEEARAFRHLEATGSGGLRLAILPELELKAGLGLRRELLDRDGQSLLGAELGYELKRTPVLRLLDSPVQLESVLSAFVGDLRHDTTVKGTWQNRLYFTLTAGLAFNLTHELFFFAAERERLGLASQLTFGLTLRGGWSHQSF